MSATLPYWHVDAFAERPFQGNPAAVVLLDFWPEDSLLQAIAAENNFSETAFLVPDTSGEAHSELRWFTPTVEVALCGHATLASGHVVLGREPQKDAVRFRTRKSGILTVARCGAEYELQIPAITAAPCEWPEAAGLLGASRPEVWRSTLGYSLFVYPGEADVRALSPDLRALAAFGDEMFIATAPGTDTDIVSRVFVPGMGVDEDPVTGSAYAVLVPYWALRLGRDQLSAYQASRRGGRLSCRTDGENVWLRGGCVTIVESQFFAG